MIGQGAAQRTRPGSKLFGTGERVETSSNPLCMRLCAENKHFPMQELSGASGAGEGVNV